MPETGNCDSGNLYRPVRDPLMRVAPSCRVHVAWLGLPFFFLLGLQIGFAVWLTTRSEVKPHLTAVIDMNGTQQCSPPGLEGRYPCKRHNVYEGSDEPIGPLHCFDDAFAQSGGQDNCHGNQFRIANDGKGVIIPADGLYRVYAKVTFYDSTNHFLSLSVRIDPPYLTGCHGSHVCQDARDNRAHAWLTCNAHQPPAAANATSDFASCAIDGIRRFAAGEVVGLQVAIGFRHLSGHHKATYMYIHKL